MPSKPFYDAPNARSNWVRPMPFEDLKAKYREHVVLEKREDGVVLCRLHTQGGPAKFSLHSHHAIPALWRDLGADPSNELIILTGTGDVWCTESDPGSWEAFDPFVNGFDHYTRDATQLIESYLYNIDIPTITAFNGPGFHTEFAFMSDIRICSDKASFNDGHYLIGYPPGDGQAEVFIELAGLTRGAWMAYTGEAVNAQKALEYNLVSEVVPHDKLLDRAYAIADQLMKAPRSVRRLTHLILVRRWKEIMHKNLGYSLGHELMGVFLEHKANNEEGVKKAQNMDNIFAGPLKKKD